MNLSKSRYTLGIRCPKLLWLSIYKPELAEDTGTEAVFENGNVVGDLARHLFGDNYTLIDFDKGFESMIKETNEKLKEKPNIICEASFSYDNNFCSVDILKNDKDGVELYEVKSSTEVKEIYIHDIAYQTWVLKECGLNVKKSFIVYVNKDYVLKGKLDLNKFFNIKEVSNLINLKDVPNNVEIFKDIINNKKEPNDDLNIECNSPYQCPFFKYCTKDLPSPNVFDVGCGVRFNKKLDLYYDKKISYKDINGLLIDKANEQVDFYLNNREPKINKEVIKELLNKLEYPLYFLDFESYQDSIPKIEGTKPYQQICFQYSLHYYLEKDGELFHKEFLNDNYDGNPMYELSKKLCEDIPLDSCIVVYNDAFEKTRLKEMADMFPEFREHLLNIRDNIIDLLPPFKSHDYYVKEMGGSSSIKYVLPALFPDDPSLDYHNLDQVHKGDEASNAYLSLKNLPKDEEIKLRENMLKYCKLDTYAMVKIYEKLKEVL